MVRWSFLWLVIWLSTELWARPLTASQAGPVIQGYLQEVDQRVAALSRLYDYGSAAQGTLRQAMQSRGVHWSLRYVQSWGDNGLYVIWQDAHDSFYSSHRDKLQASLRAVQSAGAVEASDLEYLKSGMQKWREMERQITASLKQQVDLMAQRAAMLDAQQQGARNQAPLQQLGAEQDRVRDNLRVLQSKVAFSAIDASDRVAVPAPAQETFREVEVLLKPAP